MKVACAYRGEQHHCTKLVVAVHIQMICLRYSIYHDRSSKADWFAVDIQWSIKRCERFNLDMLRLRKVDLRTRQDKHSSKQERSNQHCRESLEVVRNMNLLTFNYGPVSVRGMGGSVEMGTWESRQVPLEWICCLCPFKISLRNVVHLPLESVPPFSRQGTVRQEHVRV